MKVFYPTVLSIGFILLLLFMAIELRAATSSTSGIYQTPPQVKNIPQPKTTPPVCVDSGIQGRRCGLTAINFCKINPDAINCNTILKDKK